MRTFALSLLGLCLISLSHAQWETRSYSIAPGWNGIWLAGDTSYTTVDQLLASYPTLTEVWRWNPNPDQITFTTSPSDPTTPSDEWTVWKRDGSEQVLQRLVANSAYLIRNNGSTTINLALLQLVTPPAATWQISGANFLGFPVGTANPLINQYFTSFPSANTTVLAPGVKIFRYIGGEFSAANPMAVNPNAEILRRDTAYWFQVDAVSDFTAPLEYELPSEAGLAFGRTLTAITVGVTNRSTLSMTVNVALLASEAAPTGQQPVNGPILLTRRIYDSETGTTTETPIEGSFNVTIPGSGRANLEFGIDRSNIADSGAFHASILRLRDTGNLTEVRLPVSAQAATSAGLWIMQASVTQVANLTNNPGGTNVSRPFPLVFLLHVDENGVSRLLSQAFTGRLVTSGNPFGLAISEDRILPFTASDIAPRRYVSSQMPLIPWVTGSGTVATESALTWAITVEHDDRTNPFVHSYHPDHDNLDASFQIPLEAGQESYRIVRSGRFTFTAEPPNGGAVSGWGTTILGGIYEETVTGINARPIDVSGTFAMQRISEIAEIDLEPPQN